MNTGQAAGLSAINLILSKASAFLSAVPTWLYVVLGIVLFFTVIMLIPVGVRATNDDEFKAKLKIAFVSVTLYPPKPKKPKKQKKKKEKKKKEEKEEKPREKKPSLVKQKGVMWVVDLIVRLAELTKGILKDFFRHVVIKRLQVSIRHAGEDAADTAVKYGYLCSAVYPAVSLIAGASKCAAYGVDITPDFTDGASSYYYIDFYARVRIFWLVVLVIKNGIKALKLFIDLKNS